jgi:uncharacterized protein (TIGR02466 family)
MNVPEDDTQELKEVATLFPTNVFKFQLPQIEQNLDEIRKFVEADCAAGPSQLTNFRISENTKCNEKEELKWLVDLIYESARKVLDWNQVSYEDCYVSEMWINQAGPGYRHPIHSHSNSLLSGCIYVDMPEGASPTLFYDPRPAFRVIEPNYKDYGPHNSGVVGMQTEVGDMMFWDSALPHAYEVGFWDPEQNDEGQITKWRTTINFNIMIKADIDIPTAMLTLR